MPPRYERPEAGEYPAYFTGYINGVPDGELLSRLEQQAGETAALLATLPEERGDFAYAPGKWTIKEVLAHVIDTERVFGYRALHFARGDAAPLPSFDEQRWAPNSGASSRTLADLLAELRAVRAATVALFRHLPAEAAARRGTASGWEVSVRALAWIIAGHELHHRRLLASRYGVGGQ